MALHWLVPLLSCIALVHSQYAQYPPQTPYQPAYSPQAFQSPPQVYAPPQQQYQPPIQQYQPVQQQYQPQVQQYQPQAAYQPQPQPQVYQQPQQPIVYPPPQQVYQPQAPPPPPPPPQPVYQPQVQQQVYQPQQQQPPQQIYQPQQPQQVISSAYVDRPPVFPPPPPPQVSSHPLASYQPQPAYAPQAPPPPPPPAAPPPPSQFRPEHSAQYYIDKLTTGAASETYQRPSIVNSETPTATSTLVQGGSEAYSESRSGIERVDHLQVRAIRPPVAPTKPSWPVQQRILPAAPRPVPPPPAAPRLLPPPPPAPVAVAVQRPAPPIFRPAPPPPPPPPPPPQLRPQPAPQSQSRPQSARVSALQATADANAVFLQCCQRKRVDPRCESRCTFDGINKRVLTGMFLGTDPCPPAYGRDLLGCAASEFDHSDCCRSLNVQRTSAGEKCLGFCNLAPGVVFQADVSMLPCWGVLNDIKICFKSHITSQRRHKAAHKS